MNDFTNCPYWGIGGRYIADPVTGQRTRVAAADAPMPEPVADGLAAEVSATTTQSVTSEGEQECQIS